MKKIKFILIAFVAMFITLGTTSVYAQEDGNRDANGYVVRGPYLTNGGGSNWFVGVAGGANSFYNNREFGNYGWAANAYVGKWFTPSVGARLGYSYGTNAVKTNSRFSDPYRQQFIHADAMWNMSNAIGGYKETRFWDFIPYAQAGVLLLNNIDPNATVKVKPETEYAMGFGLVNELRLSPSVNLNIDLGAVVAREASFVAPTTGPRVVLPQVTVGVSFNLGQKKNFDRYSSVAPKPVTYPFTEQDYYNLKSKGEQLEKDNATLREDLEKCKNAPKETVVVKDTIVMRGPLNLYFKRGKSKLTDANELSHFDDYMEIYKVAERGRHITVTGSADKATGSHNYNLKLSRERAEYVKRLLMEAGVPEKRIDVKVAEPGTLFDTNELNRVVVIE